MKWNGLTVMATRREIREWDAAELERAAKYGVCRACRTPRDVREDRSDPGVLALELVCPNGCPQ